MCYLARLFLTSASRGEQATTLDEKSLPINGASVRPEIHDTKGKTLPSDIPDSVTFRTKPQRDDQSRAWMTFAFDDPNVEHETLKVTWGALPAG